jgi:predicted dehydrogenase
MNKKIRMGMIGGSLNGFIGGVHRMAAALDQEIELVCGCFSENELRSKETGQRLGLNEERIYTSYALMLEKESQLPKEDRLDFITVVTPNYLHYAPAQLALEKGFHVLCEKPMTFSVKEAVHLYEQIKQSGLLFGLTHNYIGYPMVKEARSLIQAGRIGKVRKVFTNYLQGWLSQSIESEGQKQASWRTDPSKAGLSCCVGDIGTHAFHLTEWITGLMVNELAADVSTFVANRLLDDDASILIRFENGAKGCLSASQIACGEENELSIKIYGDLGGIEWLQSDPNTLIVKNADGSKEIRKTGAGNTYLSQDARNNTRLPGGHPEGYIESLANIYRDFAKEIYDFKNGIKNQSNIPGVADGVRGMQFIESALFSGKNNAQWVKI